jgi:hypothetical protein
MASSPLQTYLPIALAPGTSNRTPTPPRHLPPRISTTPRSPNSFSRTHPLCIDGVATVTLASARFRSYTLANVLAPRPITQGSPISPKTHPPHPDRARPRRGTSYRPLPSVGFFLSLRRLPEPSTVPQLPSQRSSRSLARPSVRLLVPASYRSCSIDSPWIPRLLHFYNPPLILSP